MSDFNPNLIYQRIQDACRDNNTTITALCKSLTGSQGNLATWKKGNIRIEHLLKISHFTNVSLDYLTGITDTKEKKPSLFESFSAEEVELIKAYRKHPEARVYARRILGLEAPPETARIAAKGNGEIQAGKKKPKITE